MAYVPMTGRGRRSSARARRTTLRRGCGKPPGICSTSGTRRRRNSAWRLMRSSGCGASGTSRSKLPLKLAMPLPRKTWLMKASAAQVEGATRHDARCGCQDGTGRCTPQYGGQLLVALEQRVSEKEILGQPDFHQDDCGPCDLDRQENRHDQVWGHARLSRAKNRPRRALGLHRVKIIPR